MRQGLKQGVIFLSTTPLTTTTFSAHSIRELMIKRECAKNPELKNESWDKFMPQYAKKNVKKQKVEKKPKKEYTPFPPPQQPSKIDLQLGE